MYTPAIDYLHILHWVLGSIAYRNWMKSGQPRFNKKLEQYKMNCYFFTDFEFSFFDSQTVTIILWYETWKWNGYELWYHSSFSTNCFDVFDSTVFLSHLCWIINNRGWFRFYFCQLCSTVITKIRFLFFKLETTWNVKSVSNKHDIVCDQG